MSGLVSMFTNLSLLNKHFCFCFICMCSYFYVCMSACKWVWVWVYQWDSFTLLAIPMQPFLVLFEISFLWKERETILHHWASPLPSYKYHHKAMTTFKYPFSFHAWISMVREKGELHAMEIDEFAFQWGENIKSLSSDWFFFIGGAT